MDLFIDIVDEAKQHHNYKQIKKDKYKKEVINKWADTAIVNRDGCEKFIKEFQTEFNSCFWELYIYQCLKKVGCKFDLSHAYPDFIVSLPQLGRSFTVECTVASNAQGTTPEYDMEAKLNDNTCLDEKVYNQTIRLANSLVAKYNKYVKLYSKETWVQGVPYIIAIEPFEQPNSFVVGNEGIMAMLYGELLDRYSGCYDTVDGIYKQNGSKVELGYFMREKYNDISAVLFSNVATIGKVDAIGGDPELIFHHIRINKNGTERITRTSVRNPIYDLQKENDEYSFYRETITDGLTLYLNPYAKIPIHNKVIWEMYNAGINILRYDLEEQDFDESLIHDGSLVHRLVQKFNFFPS